MRTLVFAILALIALITLVQGGADAQSSKSICLPIQVGNATVNPNLIPPSVLWNMTSSAGKQDYNIAVSLCNAIPTKACGDSAYIAVASVGPNVTCVATFDTALSRPTATAAGLTVTYGSTSKANSKDMAIISIVCNSLAPASLSTRSHRFAVRPNNKLGGNTYMMIAYSSAACASKPAPPPSDKNATCRRFVVGNTLVNPLSWEPSYLTLQAGFFGGKTPFLFSPCDATPTVPKSLPACKNTGYITRYSETACTGAFTQMTKFAPGLEGLRIMYEMTGPKGNDVVALITVTCMKGATQLRSPTGMYTTAQTNGTTYMIFPLGHEDLCFTPRTTRPAVTKPTTPTRWTWPLPTIPHVTWPHNWTLPTGTGHWTWPTNFTWHTIWPHPTEPTRPLPTATGITRPHPPTKPTRWTMPPHTGTFPPRTLPPQTWTKPSAITSPPFSPLPTGLTKPSHPIDPTRPPMTKPPVTNPPVDPTRPPPLTRPPLTKPSMPVDPTIPPRTRPMEPTAAPTKPIGKQ